MLKRLLNVRTVPIVLLLFAIAAFGILLPSLGFYWDDWPMVWFAHTLGPLGFLQVFSGDRPFLAGIYILTTSIIQNVPLQWQILGILSRWLTALSLWWTLRLIWPRRVEQITWIAILFTVFPGFKQMPISVVYSNAFFLLIFYILSFGLMVLAIRRPNRYWLYTILALVGYSICTFSTEYYVGLDMVRPVLIWLLLIDTIPNWKDRLKATARQWIPYAVVLVIFLIWRVLIFQFPTYKPDMIGRVVNSPVQGLLTLVSRVFDNMIATGWVTWAETFRYPQLSDFKIPSETYYWITVVIALIFSGFYLIKANLGPSNANQEPEHTDHWPYQPIWIGLIWLFCAGWPFWITDMSVELQYPFDRFSLAFMIGSCILLVGLLEWAIRTHLQKAILLTLVIAFAIGANLQTANTYRREWSTQKEMFWQLTWRAPGLKPGTLVATNALPLRYYSDNSLTAPLNWIYAPDNHSIHLPYYFAFTGARVGHSIADLKNGLPINQVYRNASFSSSTSNAIVIFYSPPGCLHVVDPIHDSQLPIYPKEIQKAMIISHPDQIIIQPASDARPPLEIFGLEPARTWCYYFERAELARQAADWNEVAALGDQVFKLGFNPGEPSELIVFIEGYAHTNQWSRSMELTGKAYSSAKSLQDPLCQILTTFSKSNYLKPDGKPFIDKTSKKLECPGS